MFLLKTFCCCCLFAFGEGEVYPMVLRAHFWLCVHPDDAQGTTCGVRDLNQCHSRENSIQSKSFLFVLSLQI